MRAAGSCRTAVANWHAQSWTRLIRAAGKRGGQSLLLSYTLRTMHVMNPEPSLVPPEDVPSPLACTRPVTAIEPEIQHAVVGHDVCRTTAVPLAKEGCFVPDAEWSVTTP